MHHDASTTGTQTLDQKVEFLSRADAYSGFEGLVVSRETHMSWVFLAGDKVYKLKKPVRFPYLDFTTLARREAACRAELRLNRRLAADVYLDVVPLCATALSLSIGGHGSVVDWLVVMRRLDEAKMLNHALVGGRVASSQIDRLAAKIVEFYRHAARILVTPQAHLAQWSQVCPTIAECCWTPGLASHSAWSSGSTGRNGASSLVAGRFWSGAYERDGLSMAMAICDRSISGSATASGSSIVLSSMPDCVRSIRLMKLRI